MQKIEDTVGTITTFEYRAFDMQKAFTGFMYDATPQQCCDMIWKDICFTAVIKKITVFNLETNTRTHVDTRLIKNKFEPEKQPIKTSIKETFAFKKQHNLE